MTKCREKFRNYGTERGSWMCSLLVCIICLASSGDNGCCNCSTLPVVSSSSVLVSFFVATCGPSLLNHPRFFRGVLLQMTKLLATSLLWKASKSNVFISSSCSLFAPLMQSNAVAERKTKQNDARSPAPATSLFLAIVGKRTLKNLPCRCPPMHILYCTMNLWHSVIMCDFEASLHPRTVPASPMPQFHHRRHLHCQFSWPTLLCSNRTNFLLVDMWFSTPASN